MKEPAPDFSRPGPARLTILGGGIAGLAVAHHAEKLGLDYALLEANARLGGNCITLEHDGFRFDSGAHRLHNKAPGVTRELGRLLGDRLRPVARPSKFFDNGRFVDHPVSAFNLLRVLGPALAARAAVEIAISRLRPARPCSSYEEFAVGRYGRAMAERYLLPFTSKIWNVPCGRLVPEVAAKRFQEFGARALFGQLLGRRQGPGPGHQWAYFYPEGGIGAIAAALAAGCRPGALRTSAAVTAVEHAGGRIRRVTAGGASLAVDEVVSTLPLDVLVGSLHPAPPPEIAAAAGRIRYRAVLLAAFFLDRPAVTGAATLYFADPAYAVSRVYEPRNRDEGMAPPGKTSLVAEIPCSNGDAAWALPDGEIVRLARSDLVRAGLLAEREIIGSRVHRMPHAYPVMETGMVREAGRILDYLGGFANLKLAGRSACYRYLWMHELIAAAGELAAGYAAPPAGGS